MAPATLASTPTSLFYASETSPITVHSSKPTLSTFDSMEEALAAFSAGEFVIVMDDKDRENEGDLIISASQCTTEKMAWMIKHTSGYVCAALPGRLLEELNIPMMVKENQDPRRTAYSVTVDCKHGTSLISFISNPRPVFFGSMLSSLIPRLNDLPRNVGTTTGISAHDRALTVRALASPTSTADDFIRPGHIVPLRAREGGVFVRKGHTESAVDLCLLTGQPPVGVLCEIVNDDVQGTMARRDDCRILADRYGLKMITVEMIVQWRKQHSLVDTTS